MKAIIIGLGVTWLIHAIFALIATKDLKDYPLFSNSKKIYWFFLIWLIPFLGSHLFFKNIGYDWNSNNSNDRHSSSGEGTDGGSGGC